MSSFGNSNVESYLVGVTTNPQPNNRVTVSLPNGNVFSMQPDGSRQTRPAGTNGPFEQALVTPKGLLFDGMNDPIFKGNAYLVSYIE
jgi:hypothetical protein